MYKFFSDVVAYVRGGGKEREIGATLPDSEPPSAMTALRWALSRATKPPVVRYTIAKPPEPDVREPRARLDHVLFRHDGETWHPAIEAPSPSTVTAVESIARTGFSMRDWSDRARELAPKIGADALRVIAHGSAPPADFDSFDWVRRMQMGVDRSRRHEIA